MSYSSSREAAFRLKAGGILSQRLPGAVWAMCRLVAKLAGVVGSAATFLVAKESMKRRGVVTLRAAGRHAHSEGQEGAARRFEGERLGRRAASGHWRWRARVLEGPPTRHQRCWLHKTLNVLDKLPKSMQPNAHKDLREIWLSPAGQRARRGQRHWHGPGSGSRGTHVSALFHDETGRPWHGTRHLPINRRSPWRGIVGSAARAPWSRCPLH
jgi:hypothetical protein